MIHSLTHFHIAEFVGVYAYMNSEVVDDRKRYTDLWPVKVEQLNSGYQGSYLPELSTFFGFKKCDTDSQNKYKFFIKYFQFHSMLAFNDRLNT